ncbi:uncharacterized protein LOC142530563 [Primulina tabacum]|uniref:uncharacterized protein LOC142530563 n=1 Tax=Primulina tabacum TaxID=48773 RepID=UPI003F5A3B66
MSGSDIVQQTTDSVVKIRDRMKTLQSRQKSYADKRRRDLEFDIGDHDIVKIAPMKQVMRFGKKVKLSPRFIGPFEILEKVGALAYKIIPNLTYEEKPTQILGRQGKRLRNKEIKMFKVK